MRRMPVLLEKPRSHVDGAHLSSKVVAVNMVVVTSA